ncbi:MAG: type II secretion system F family protein [Candidatus Nanohaloarchaea archaeon]
MTDEDLPEEAKNDIEEEEEENGEEQQEEEEEPGLREKLPGLDLQAWYERFPPQYKELVEGQLKYTGMDQAGDIVIKLMALTAAVSLAVTIFLLPYSLMVRAILAIVSVIALPPLAPYTYIALKAESRKKEMEQILPDALKLVAANMKSGHTIEKAFLLSARDEFGPLAEELRQTAMAMYGGTPVEEALEDMQDRVKSDLFQETLKLLVDGIESGGDTSELLASSAEDIRNSLEIREEIKSNIRMYMVFIVMAAVFGAPILFSISVYMSQTTTQMWRSSGIGNTSQTGQGLSKVGSGFNFQFQAPQVDIQFFPQFALMTIIVTNIFSAFIISEIQNGNIKQGVKYIPIFVTISTILFLVTKSTLAGVMGSF